MAIVDTPISPTASAVSPASRLVLRVLSFWRGQRILCIHGRNGTKADGTPIGPNDPDEAAVRGADCLAGAVARELGFAVLPFPADWTTHGRRAGPLRNTQMLREGRPRLVLAFTNDLRASRGTRHMCAIAVAAGVPVRVLGARTSRDGRELLEGMGARNEGR